MSVSTLQPFLTYLLADGWAASLNAETSYNWTADSDRWTVPLAAGLSKVVNLGGRYVNLAVAGIDYVEKPAYAPDWELRTSMTYVPVSGRRALEVGRAGGWKSTRAFLSGRIPAIDGMW